MKKLIAIVFLINVFSFYSINVYAEEDYCLRVYQNSCNHLSGKDFKNCLSSAADRLSACWEREMKARSAKLLYLY